MFTSIYNHHRFVNPIFDICKKSTNDVIRRLTEKNKQEKNKLNINSKMSPMVLNSEPPNPILQFLPFFCFISVTYFYYSFSKRIK